MIEKIIGRIKKKYLIGWEKQMESKEFKENNWMNEMARVTFKDGERITGEVSITAPFDMEGETAEDSIYIMIDQGTAVIEEKLSEVLKIEPLRSKNMR